jgi:PAS domain S-box-containing protein
MRTRAPYMSNDAERDPHVIPDVQQALGFRNLADVPIINHQGELLGCFEVHNKPGGFNETDLLMLQGLAASAAIALENAGLLAERKLAEEALLAANQKLALHFQQTPLGVIEWDMKFRVARWNSAAERIFGFTAQEAVGQHGMFIVPESDRASVKLLMESLLAGESIEQSTNENVRQDGTLITCEWYNTSLVDADGHVVGVASQVQDITGRMASEARIRRLTQLYLALSQCNQAIVRSKDQAELFANLCRSAVLFGGMKMAWVGLVDIATKRVTPVASFGDHVDYLEGIQISVDAEDPLGRGPTGTAVSENQPFWCQDFQNDPSTAPWRERGLRSGWCASAALPLHKNGVAVGAFTLYSAQADAFDDEARDLLGKMAADISHALDTLEAESKRKQAETELRESQELFSLYLSHSPIYTFIKTVTATESRVLYASENFREMIGIPGQDMVGKTMGELFPPEFAAKVTADDWAVVAGGGVLKLDEDLNGRSYTTIKFPIVQGGKTLLAGYTIDITDRKQAEERLRLSEQTYSGILNSVAEAVYIQDESGMFLDVNHASEKLYGYAKEEFLGRTPEFLSAPGKNDLSKLRTALERSLNGEPQSFEFWGRRKDGTIFPKDVSTSLGYYFGKKVIIAVARDITERKLAEEALHMQTEELRARNETLTRFNRVAVDRELRMVELKREVNELCVRLGVPPRHRLAEDEMAPPAPKKDQE